MASDPYSLVSSTFSLAQTYANNAQESLTSYLDQLNKLNYAVPTVSVQWSSIAPPSLAQVGALPTLPEIALNVVDEPTAFSDLAPTVNIDATFESAPSITLPTLNQPSFGVAPTVPSVGAVTVPDAPTFTMPGLPTLLSVSTVTFGGVDLHEAMLDRFDTIPELTLVAPTPYSYTQGAAYSSVLLAALKAKLASRLEGGTGLTPAIEQAIWDRGRSREQQLSLANEAEVLRTSEAMGFQLPAGATAMALRAAQQDTVDKGVSASRDIAVKQAELEQENLKSAITEGIGLEGKLVDYSLQLERLTFDSSKAAADNAVAIHNAGVQEYQALLAGFDTLAKAYQTVIAAQQTKVEIYKAELQAELTKAQINSTLVEQYRVSTEATRIQADLYRTQLEGSRVLVEIEKLKIDAAGEQVRAYVARVNAEVSKIEAYKAGVQGQGLVVDIYKTKAQAFATVVGAQADKSKAELAGYQAKIAAKTLEWDGFKSKLDAEKARLTALTSQSSMLLDGYKASTAAVEATANNQARLWETQIKDYEAGMSITQTNTKMNTDAFISTRQAQQDAAKVGAQVFAQLTSSAYSILHASAGITGAGSTSVSYNYGGDVSSDVAPLTSA